MKKEFKHTLPTDDIIIRQDKEVNTEFFEKNIGQLYPLIRIKEHTINFPEIVSFNLSCGIESFLPMVEIVIDDAEYIFRESNFIDRGDVITIWVGNGKDTEHEVVKNNYYVLDVSSTPGSQFVTITSVLNVPKLWQSTNRVISGDAVSVLKTLAKECQLGFVSNIESSNDDMKWIQTGTTRKFFDHIIKDSFIDVDNLLVVFIDQFANLNVMDLSAGLNDLTKTQLTTMPISGEKLDTPVPLYATNTNNGTETPKAQIINWTPTTQYGLDSMKFTAKVKSISTHPVTNIDIEQETSLLNPQMRQSSTFTTFHNESVHSNFGLAKASNINNKQLLQNVKIQATLDYFIPVIYLGMNLPVEIWNKVKNEKIESQDPNIDAIELDEEAPTGKSNALILNTQMSGDTILLSLNIGYNRKTSTTGEDKFVRQSITVMKKQK